MFVGRRCAQENDKNVTKLRQQYEREVKELQQKYELKMKLLRDDLELRRKVRTHPAPRARCKCFLPRRLLARARAAMVVEFLPRLGAPRPSGRDSRDRGAEEQSHQRADEEA